MSNERALSVGQLTGRLKSVIEQSFPQVWVSGEISDLARPRSGHLYFTLKDSQAQIRGVIWRSSAARLNFEPEDGQEVLCFGDVEVYAARGSYQLIVRKMQPQGLGALQQAYEKLRAKLYAEGLFDADRKRPLPAAPRRIAIVTSPTGAALHDFLEAAAQRNSSGEIVVVPSLVQGDSASRSIAAAIGVAADLIPRPDVLVVSRGGGSMEDLWCFNDERVVRAIASSPIPTVSAVGHEIDVTLADLAADVRALTPTDGAIRSIPDGRQWRDRLTNLNRRLGRAMTGRVDRMRLRFDALCQRPVIRNPRELLNARSRQLDELDDRARRASVRRLELAKARLGNVAGSLNALSPLSVLARGYSVTLNQGGDPVNKASDVAEGDVITTRLSEGQIQSRVI
ncbi:MAG: exodeoxyribonuclease VII large subunit [Planctomycetota bacterium]